MGCRMVVSTYQKPRRYGLWLFTCPRPLRNPAVLREDRMGRDVSTQFQRTVGITHRKRVRDSKGIYGGYGLGPPRNIVSLLKGLFCRGPLPRRKLTLRPGHRTLLARSTGYAILWAPRLQLVSVAVGAHLIGTISLTAKDEL